MRISTTQVSWSNAQVEKVGNPGEKMWKLKEPLDENQTEFHEIEPNPSKDRAMPEGDNPFVLRWIYIIYFFLHNSIHIRNLKQVEV
jgi:hypothetical protein